MTIDALILRKLANGPLYARTFHAAKPVVERLIRLGKVERCAPPGGRGKNMVRLAQKEPTP